MSLNRFDDRYEESFLSRASLLSNLDESIPLNPALQKQLKKKKRKSRKLTRGRKGRQPRIPKKKEPLEIKGSVVLSLAERKNFEDRQEAAEKQKLLQQKLLLSAESLRLKQDEGRQERQLADTVSQRDFVARAGESRARAEADRDRLAFEVQRHNESVNLDNRRIDVDIQQLRDRIQAEERAAARELAEAAEIRRAEAEAREQAFIRAREEQEVDLRFRDNRLQGEFDRARLESDERRQEGQLAHEREVRIIDRQRQQDSDKAALDLERQKALQSELDFLHRQRAANTQVVAPSQDLAELRQADRQFLQDHQQQIDRAVSSGFEDLRSELRSHFETTQADQARRDELAAALPQQLSTEIRSVLQPLAASASEPEPQARVQRRISSASSTLSTSSEEDTPRIGGQFEFEQQEDLTASSLDRQFAGDTQAVQEQAAEEARIATREIEALGTESEEEVVEPPPPRRRGRTSGRARSDASVIAAFDQPAREIEDSPPPTPSVIAAFDQPARAPQPQPEPAPEPTPSPTVQPRILRGDPEQTERFGEFATPEQAARSLGGQRKVIPQVAAKLVPDFGLRRSTFGPTKRDLDKAQLAAVAQQEASAAQPLTLEQIVASPSRGRTPLSSQETQGLVSLIAQSESPQSIRQAAGRSPVSTPEVASRARFVLDPAPDADQPLARELDPAFQGSDFT